MIFLIGENDAVTLANEIILSIENKNQFYVGISLSISTIENMVIENIVFCQK